MIKASGKTPEGRPLLVIGLSRKNTERLLTGMPIRFAGDEFGIEADIIVLGGETENDIVEDLRSIAPLRLEQP